MIYGDPRERWNSVSDSARWVLEDARGEGESRLKGLTGVVIEDVDGKPFSEYGRYLANARQVIVVVQGTGWGA